MYLELYMHHHTKEHEGVKDAYTKGDAAPHENPEIFVLEFYRRLIAWLCCEHCEATRGHPTSQIQHPSRHAPIEAHESAGYDDCGYMCNDTQDSKHRSKSYKLMADAFLLIKP